MIPIFLKIKGLYSYREEVEIDFSRLAEAHLFGIFGPVGSGKSAILEAITYALYGQTERLNASGDNRGYNMMNLQGQEMAIAFEFKTTTAEGEARYLFRVSHRRSSKQFGEVRSPVRSALVWRGGEWQPLESTDAEQVLNLSYDNFTKTIIIPQGKFQAFLHMGATVRTRMLRELFSLDQYELDRPTKALVADTNASLKVLEGQLLELGEVSEEELSEKDARAQTLQTGLEEAIRQLRQQEEALQAHRQRKGLATQVMAARQEADALEAQVQDFARREQEAQAYQRLVMGFRDGLAQEAKLRQEVGEANAGLQAVTLALESLAPQLAAARSATLAAQQAWEGKGVLEAQVQDYGHLLAIREGGTTLERVQARLDKGAEVLQDVEQKMQEAEALRTACEANIAQQRQRLPDLVVIGEVQVWHQRRAAIDQQLAVIEERLLQLRQEQAQGVEEQARLLGTLGLQPQAGHSPAAALQARLHTLRQQVDESRLRKEQLYRRSGLAALVADVVPDEPCPLCGSTHHPHPYDSSAFAEEFHAAEAHVQALETQVAAVEKAIATLDTWRVLHEEKEQQVQRLLHDQTLQQEALAQHIAAFTWVDYHPDAPNEVELDRKAAVDIQAALKEEEEVLRQITAALKTSQESHQRYAVAMNGLREDKNLILGQMEARRKQLAALTEADVRGLDPDELKAGLAQAQERLAAIARDHQSTLDTERQLEKREVELQQQQRSTAAQQAKLHADHAALQSTLSQKVAQWGYADLAAIQAILATDLDWEGEQRAVALFHQHLHAARATLKSLQGQVQSAPYDAEAHAQAEDAFAEAMRRTEAQREEALLLREELARLQQDLDKRRALEVQQASQQTRLAHLKVLEGLFKASGFVKYVSTIHLQELVHRADARFRALTRNALSLELGDDHEFLVRDMLNGGQTRSVKTLSGGQTFQASLCLALALADNVQQRSRSAHNFFFLDEGFGTLDRDSLATVFATLQRLRQEHRIVGVISHVDEMQQEIEVYLRVWQTEDRGSQVRGSWE